jgi:menaquinol-cytochrome c reductase iron-sulfur subunit
MLRRGFFAGLAAVLAGLAAGAVAFLWPGRGRLTPAEYDAGAADSFAVGDVRHFQVSDDVSPYLAQGAPVRPAAPRDFHLVRRPDGFVAFWHRCTHLGCAVPFRPEFEFRVLRDRTERVERGLFRCPCHGSTFSRDEGQTVFGPAPRPLDALPVRIERGRVLVTVRGGAERRRADHQPAPLAVWPR